ncbi:MgtC/SapB family protein [Crocosphaera sp. UHCC 0190]|uniref:MgtC/SapB family protein n=1 Tax=Crocosphaera sp. UHCC 0190 TaxID=3110246 RepID=UPI002B1FEF74|nr:MgtC/SapB family protein [Crocosphaera sp. UHCC 0190]MEA5512216.1 MgtC/SapB family protein [Crocosphaera sp. UHCC 0190]
MDLTIATQLAIALIIGLIIGLERGWKTRKNPTGHGDGGLRNFGLSGLFGGIAALLAAKWGIMILGVIFLGLSALVSISYVLTAQKSQDYGTTTEIALLITFALGAMVVSGWMLEAVAIAVIISWLLGLKEELHRYLILLQRQELIATLQLLLIAVVFLPLLPNQSMGPWQAINPRSIGLLVLLIAAISYIGYFSIRILGNHVGLLLTGLFGGIASSTALTLAFSRLAKQREDITILLAAGIALANGMMAPRLLIEIAVINPALAQQLMLPLIVLGINPLICAAVLVWRLSPSKSMTPLKLSNPVELGAALQYAALLAILSVLVHGAQAWFGEGGVYVLSAISGLADVDAVGISLAQAVNDNMSIKVGMIGTLLAVAMNTMVKVGMTAIIGGKILAYWCAGILLGSLVLSMLITLIKVSIFP